MGKGPTQLASFETMHITHILEQVIRGYLCGSNDKGWSSHVFNYNHMSTYDNIQTYFYRFEFQSRGTVHVHLLVWLKDIKRIRLNLIRADIPWADPELSYQISKLQKSDKGAVHLRNEPTQVECINDVKVLKLYHPADAFALNLRAYISSLVPSLRCRMDVQTSDGHGMLLRYVTSYVSKWHDSFQSDALYSVHVGPYQAAYRHLISLKPLEPEMWLALTSTKMSWSPSRRKKFSFPPIEHIDSNKQYVKYLHRHAKYNNLSFIQWLRLFDDSKGTEYKSGCTLVGVKMVSPLKDLYFLQYLILNFPHRQLPDLYHRNLDQLPKQIRYFAGAYTLLHDFWSQPETIRTYFIQQGHKSWFVETLIAHISTLADFFHLFQRRVLTSVNIQQITAITPPVAIHDPLQNRFLQVVNMSLIQRDEHYNNNGLGEAREENDSEEDEYEEDINQPLPQQPTRQNQDRRPDVDWRKILLLTGKPGTGKTHCVKQAIRRAVDENRAVLVTTPTGFLATTYAAHFLDEIDTNTIHSAFQYPVIDTLQPQINWELMHYDIIVMDEISMVPKSIMQHVLSTINQISVRPVLIMCGDHYQQQPISTVDQQILKVPSILEDTDFYAITNHFNLTKQHRCDDPRLMDILNHLRCFRPSEELLAELHEERILCTSRPPSDIEIERTLKHIANATVVTVRRRAANRVNNVAIAYLFQGQTPIMTNVQCDCDLPPIPLYPDMSVIISQNRDKENGVVNGQRATVRMVQNKTIFLSLPSGLVVATHLVTSLKPDSTTKTCYPFVPAYAITICKSQGQTLEKVIVWMDSATAPAGAAYVALSRVRRLTDLYFMTRTYQEQYKPVRAEID